MNVYILVWMSGRERENFRVLSLSLSSGLVFLFIFRNLKIVVSSLLAANRRRDVPQTYVVFVGYVDFVILFCLCWLLIIEWG